MLKIKDYNVIRFSSKNIVLNEGSEANITIDKRNFIVYKEWKAKMTGTIPNKVEKLNRLEEISQLDDYMVKTYYLVKRNDQIKGYVMPYEQTEEDDFYNLSFQTKLNYLYAFKDTINFLKDVGVYYFDFSPKNIYVKNGKIKLYDKDNVQIGDLKSDLHGIFLKNYLEKGGKLDCHAMIYAYNCFVFSLLSKTFGYRLAKQELINHPNLYRSIIENKDIETFVHELLEDKINGIIDHDYLVDRFKI